MIAELSFQENWKKLEKESFKRLMLLSHPANLARYLGYQVAPHHQAILDHIISHKKTLDLAPRGHGKSTVGTIIFSLWKILVDPDVRILIVSNTDRQAKAFLREIKAHLESDKIINLFGNLQGSKWTDEEITLANRSKIFKEATITTLGASGAVITKHFDVLIADDLVDFENARTETQRAKLKEWFYMSLLPTLEPDGELHVFGTRYHPSDLYQTLIDSQEYDIQIMRALVNEDISLWPEMFPPALLQRIKAEMGSIIFNLQYQNDVELAKQDNIFKYDWIRLYDSSELPRDLKIYMGVDLAISQKETADYFVICVIGLDPDNNIYVLDIYRARLSFKQQIAAIQRFNEKWKPISIGVESNAYQRAMVDVLEDMLLPVHEITTRTDKVTRAQIRSANFENGKVFIRKDMTDFIDELVLFPDSEHDDMFDAFDFACEVATKLSVPDDWKFTDESFSFLLWGD
jgi:predicted phage terminase large subunit-like protein